MLERGRILSNRSLKRSNLVEIIGGSAISFSVKIVAAATGLLLSVFVSRTLGAEDSGLYFLSLTIVTISATISRSGFDRIIVGKVAGWSSVGAHRSVEEFRLFVLKRVCLSSCVFSFLVIFSSKHIALSIFGMPRLENVLILMSCGLLPFAVMFSYSYFFQGLKRMVSMQLSQTFGPNIIILVIIGIAFLCQFSLGLAEISVGFLLASVVSFLGVSFYWKWRGLKDSSGLTQSLDVTWRTTMPLLFVALLNSGIGWSAVILLGVWGSSTDVAIYSNAARSALLVMLVLQAVNNIAAPKLGECFERGDNQGLKDISVMSTSLAMLVGFPIVFILVVFSEELMTLFGEDFRSGSTALSILALAQLVNIATGPVGWLLSLGGLRVLFLRNTLVSFLLLLLLSYLLIPKYGVNGAALAQAFGLVTQMLFNVLAVKAHFGFFPFWSFRPKKIME
jgi:O-antigen/teichoic acid export membrane protein